MRIEILMSKLFGFSTQTYFNWKKDTDNRPIIELLDKYFNKEDLIEFLNRKEISKLEVTNNKEVFKYISLKKYYDYVSSILEDTYKHNFLDKDMVIHFEKIDGISYNTIISNTPVFILFKYINNKKNTENTLQEFGVDMLSIYNEYDNPTFYNEGVHKLFNINNDVLAFFELFRKRKSYQCYYDVFDFDIDILEDKFYSSKESEYYDYIITKSINLHIWFENIYNNINKILLDNNLLKSESSLLFSSYLSSINYDNKLKYIVNDKRLSYKEFQFIYS